MGRPPKSPAIFRTFRGDTRDKAAAHVGMSGKTYEKAKAVVKAAIINPEYQYIVDMVDERLPQGGDHSKLPVGNMEGRTHEATAEIVGISPRRGGGRGI